MQEVFINTVWARLMHLFIASAFLNFLLFFCVQAYQPDLYGKDV